MRILIILSGILLWSIMCHGQMMDKVWCFGKYGGLDFNTSPPTQFKSKINSIETAASISDRNTGDLLFYTDGSKIWDASHHILQNGMDIGGDLYPQTSIQGAIIIPFIGNETKYYVFVRPSLGDSSGNLYYSVVDMNLNGGLGGVASSQKKIRVGGRFTEGMIVMQGCEVVWLITQLVDSSGAFYAYKISDKGIETTPVISILPYSQRPTSQSELCASADYKQIVSVGSIFGGFNDGYIALHDFDGATGKIDNGKVIVAGDAGIVYGCEFSPNGKLLYTTTNNNNIYQFDLSLATPAAITASRTVIGSSVGFLNGLRRRDDGNIYVVGYESDLIGKISNCDAVFPGCIYTSAAMHIDGTGNYTLPPIIVVPKHIASAISVRIDTTLCNTQLLTLKTQNTNATWQDGSIGNSYQTTQAGVFWAYSVDKTCKVYTDTFIVNRSDCHFFFPSAFSPNGDGLNDLAHLIGDVSAITHFRLRIFNRWGQMVFFTQDVSNGWNGYYKGRQAEMGTYFYMLQYKYMDKEELLKGDLTLIR